MTGGREEEVILPIAWDEVTSEPEASLPPVAVKPPVIPPAPPPAETVRQTAPTPAPSLPPLADPLPVPPLAPAVQAPRRLLLGQREKLSDLGLGADFEIIVQLHTPTGAIMDAACLALDLNGRLSDERYLVFYNQLATPCGGIALAAAPPASAASVFRVQLGKLPVSIHRLIIAIAIDGPGQMRDLGPSLARLQSAGGGARSEFAFSGPDFDAEKALMLLEFYRRDGAWRLAAVGQGFAGGLAALLAHFGMQAT
jgi:stress response protein SCP2